MEETLSAVRSASIEGGTALTLAGRIGIEEAQQLHGEACAAVAAPGDVKLRWQDASYLSLAAIQVLLALERELTAQGRRFAVAPAPDGIASQIRLAGCARWAAAPEGE